MDAFTVIWFLIVIGIAVVPSFINKKLRDAAKNARGNTQEGQQTRPTTAMMRGQERRQGQSQQSWPSTAQWPETGSRQQTRPTTAMMRGQERRQGQSQQSWPSTTQWPETGSRQQTPSARQNGTNSQQSWPSSTQQHPATMQQPRPQGRLIYDPDTGKFSFEPARRGTTMVPNTTPRPASTFTTSRTASANPPTVRPVAASAATVAAQRKKEQQKAAKKKPIIQNPEDEGQCAIDHKAKKVAESAGDSRKKLIIDPRNLIIYDAILNPKHNRY